MTEAQTTRSPERVPAMVRAAERLLLWFARFEEPRARRAALILGVLLVVPAVFSGFSMDDYVLLYQLGRPDGEWAGSAPFDLFRWMDAQHNRRLIDGGGLPWWTFEAARCGFFRPLSSVTHTLDYWLFDDSAVAMHVHNTLWFALLLWAAFRAYAELIESRWVAGVASVMFALDSAHGITVGWISNRNALLSGALGVTALYYHHAWRAQAGRSSPRWRAACMAFLCFGLSLQAAELAIAVLAYLGAYALCCERSSLRVRMLSLVPYAALSVVWALLRHAGDYGSYGIGVYVDPIAEPMAFVRVLPVRCLVLLSSQISRWGADLYDLVPEAAQPWLLLYALITCAVALWLSLPSLRSDSMTRTRMFAIGAVLSLPPLAATIPSDRLLTLVGFGVMPVLAQVLHDVWRSLAGPPAQPTAALTAGLRVRALAVALIAFAHFIVDPLMLPVLSLSPALIGRATERTESTLPADDALHTQTVIVTEIPDSVMLTFLPVMRAHNGRPRPDKLYWLAATHSPARYERRGPNVLRVATRDGFFDRRSEARGGGFALHPGDRVELSQLRVEVVAVTPDGRPSVCDFTFAEPLEAPAYRWQIWRAGRLQPFQVPTEL